MELKTYMFLRMKMTMKQLWVVMHSPMMAMKGRIMLDLKVKMATLAQLRMTYQLTHIDHRDLGVVRDLWDLMDLGIW